MTPYKRTGPLFTDLYELTMAASYYEEGLTSDATFSLFVRDFPACRNFLVAAGLEDVLNELTDLHFSDNEIDYLKSTKRFNDDFITYLKNFRFSGRIHAMPEGTIFFPNEPLLEVTAPLIEAQIVETFLINTIGFATLIASKAARCVLAAEGRSLIDFSLRRTQGVDAGMKVARSTYIAGFDATSNVLAGMAYHLPIAGTMAHSYVTAFDTEAKAFAAYAASFPEGSVFLIDTFDTLEGANHAVRVARQMKTRGEHLVGVRLDSGDMAKLSQKVRQILDNAGLRKVKIFASGDLDEYKIAELLAQRAVIDAFGVGTKIGVSADAPYLNIVYKLVRFKDRDIRKTSAGKIYLAGKKQVFRKSGADNRYREDVIGLRNEEIPDTARLLVKVMQNGKPLKAHPSIQTIRKRFDRNLSCLSDRYKLLFERVVYPAGISPGLAKLQKTA